MGKFKLSIYIIPWLRVFIFAILNLLFFLISGMSLNDMAPYWPIMFVVGNVISIFIFDLILKKTSDGYIGFMKNIFKEKLSWKSFLITLILMSSVGVGGMIGFSFLFFQGPPDYLVSEISWWLGIILLVLFPISAGLSETPFYYGYAYEKNSSTKKRMVFSAIYIALIYAIQHAFLPFMWDFKIIVFRILSFLPLMILITILYSRKRKLKAIVISHAIMDFFTVIQMMI